MPSEPNAKLSQYAAPGWKPVADVEPKLRRTWLDENRSWLRLLAITAALIVSLIAIASLPPVRAMFRSAPIGAEVGPWTLARVDGPVLTSPDGRRTVQVFFNDAGAAHRGNHWTWVVENSWWSGQTVVTQGYLSPEVRRGKASVPLTWGANNTITVSFISKQP